MKEVKKNEKIEGGEIAVEKSRFLSWLDNFWFHYKWPFIGITVAAIILLVCIIQSCTQRKEDMMIVYAGPVYMSQTELSAVCELMGNVLPEDFDKNDDKYVNVNTYQIYSEDQIKAIVADTDAAGNPGIVDKSYNSTEYRNYSTSLGTGENSVYLLDPWLFEDLKNNGRLAKLSDVLAETPNGAIDEYGVRLGDTALYQEFEVLQVLPEDTVVCLMKQLVAGRVAKDKFYSQEKAMFASIVGATVK